MYRASIFWLQCKHKFNNLVTTIIEEIEKVNKQPEVVNLKKVAHKVNQLTEQLG